MVRKALAVLVSASLLLAWPPAAWRAWADGGHVEYDPNTHGLVSVGGAAATSPSQALLQRLDSPSLAARLSPQQRALYRQLIEKYPTAFQGSAAQGALGQTVRQLDDSSKDPGAVLAQFFEKMQQSIRENEQDSTQVSVMGQSLGGQTLLVRDANGEQFQQKTQSLDQERNLSRQTIYRFDPKSGQEVVDAILQVQMRGSEAKRRICYSRSFMIELAGIEKAFYDQCPLVRKINDGKKPPAIDPLHTSCKDIDGTANDRLTPAAIAKMEAYYNEQRSEFAHITYWGSDGKTHTLMDYMADVEAHRKAGTLDLLRWQDLQAVQRAMMSYYSAKQLNIMETYTIGGLEGYFTQVTNSQPEHHADDTGDLLIDGLGKDQKALEAMREGKLAGYGYLMARFFGKGKLRAGDKKYITPEVMTAVAESFSMIQAAVKAQDRVKAAEAASAKDHRNRGAEIDAALQETSQWLNAARNELQVIQAATLKIEVQRLKIGDLQNNVGLTNAAAKAEADRLAKMADDYLAGFVKDQAADKKLQMRQDLSTFYTTLQDVKVAYLPLDALADRMRTLSALARELEGLYLEEQFEAVKDQPEFKSRATALDQYSTVYQYFLDQVGKDPKWAAVRQVQEAIERLAAALEAAAQSSSAGEIRAGCPRFLEMLRAIAAKLGYPVIPSSKKVADEANASKVEQARFGAAYQEFAGDAGMFYALNLADLYARKMASSQRVTSQNETSWDKFKDFLNTGMGHYFNKYTGGAREGLAHEVEKHDAIGNILTLGGLVHPAFAKDFDSTKAFEMYIAKAPERQAILALMNQGDFASAIKKLEDLDPQAAARAKQEAKDDRAEQDQFASLNIDSELTKAPEDPEMAAASAVVTSLFAQLQPLILTHMLATAIFDFGVTSVLTGFVGNIAGAVTEALRGSQMVQGALQTLRRVTMADDAFWMLRAAGQIGNLVGKTLVAVFGNFKTASEIPQVGEDVGVAVRAQRLGLSILQAGKSTARMMGTMAMFSSGMSMTQHWWDSRSGQSQFKSYGDAAVQGAVGGLSFGAQNGLLMHMSPLQASAWDGSAGRIARVFAGAGPIDWMTSAATRIFPSLGEGEVGGAIAENGLWRGLMDISPTARVAAGLTKLASTGMQVDGALKYYVLAQGSKEIGELGYFSSRDPGSRSLAAAFGATLGAAVGGLALGANGGWGAALGGAAVGGGLGGLAMYGVNRYLSASLPTDPGATKYVTNLARAQDFGMDLSQISWIALPVEAMTGSMSDYKDYKEQSYLFRRLTDEQLRQVISLPNGDESIMVDRPLGHRLANREFGEILRGEGARRSFKVDENFKRLAARKLAETQHLSTMELAALASFDPENNAGWQSLAGVLRDASSPGEQAPALSRDAALVREALKGFALEGKPARLYGYFDERGNLKSVSSEPPKKGAKASGVVAEFEVGTDGSFEWIKDAKGRVAARRLLRGAGFDRAQKALEEAVAEASAALRDEAARSKAPAGDKRDQFWVSNESIQVVRDRLAKSLLRDKALRDRILDSDEFIERKNQKTGQIERIASFRDPDSGITLAGKYFKSLRDEAARQALRPDWLTVLRSLPDRVVRELTARRQETKSEMIERSLAEDMESRAKAAMDGSPQARLGLARAELAEGLARAEKAGGEAQHVAALKELQDVLAQPGRPEDVIDRAKEKMAQIAGGNDPSRLVSVRRALASDPSPETLAAVNEAVQALAQGPLRERLAKILEAPNKKSAFQNASEALERSSQAAPVDLDRLASLGETLGGKLTADDLIYFGRQAMEAREASASGVRRRALEILERPLESSALLRLTSGRLAEALKSGDEKAAAAAADLFIDSWEEGVFGRMFKVRVDKNGETVWEIPSDYRFRDANGNAITSFRPHQLDALRANFRELAGGHRMLYDMLATSGGKTLLGFVMLSFLVPYARSRGREGAYYVTATDDLVMQAQDVYRAMFQGRKPDFEINTYSDLMQKQAMAIANGTASPGASHDLILDEYDQIGLGTPLSLGKFQGRLSFAAVDPVQKAIADGVAEVGLFKKGDPRWDEKGRGTLWDRFQGRQDMSHQEFLARYDSDRAFREAFDELAKKTASRIRQGLREVQRKGFADKISDAYAKEMGRGGRRELLAELRSEHRNAFGSATELGVLRAKYGGLDKYVFKVLAGAYEARAKGQDTLGKLYDADPQRPGIIQYHNDQALDSLDTEYRTALEAAEGAPITLDFETQAVTDFRDINEMIRDSGATAIALSGTLPDGMRPFLEGVGFKILGAGTDPNKAAGLPHQIVKPVPELAAEFGKALDAAGGKPAAMWLDAQGNFLGVGAGASGQVKLDVVRGAEGRLALADGAANAEALKKLSAGGRGKAAVERIGLTLDSLNAQDHPGSLETPYQLAVAREGILRLLRSRPQLGVSERLALARGQVEAALSKAPASERAALEGLSQAFSGKGEPNEVLDEAWKRLDASSIDAGLKEQLKKTLSRDVAYLWLDSTAKMKSALKDLAAHGIPADRVSILTRPGSAFYEKERYMSEIRADKNIDGLKSGDVDVVLLAGQGGLRGLEAPLQAYPGGEIKMFVTDSASLAKVSLLQLLGRIDKGRVPKSARTEFVLLDDWNTVAGNRYYQEAMTDRILNAVKDGADLGLLDQVKASLEARLAKPLKPEEAQKLKDVLGQIEAKRAGLAMDPEIEMKLLTDPAFTSERADYLDYQLYARIRDILGPEKLKELAALPQGERRLAAEKLIEDPRLMPALVAEMRRVVEKQQLGSSGIDHPKPSYFSYQARRMAARIWRLLDWLGLTPRRSPAAAAATP